MAHLKKYSSVDIGKILLNFYLWSTVDASFFLKKWAIPGLFFFYFHLFNTIQLTINKKCSIKICRCLESNRGLLVSEATALPTEPQPLPYVDASLSPVIVYLPLRFILKIKERDYR